MVHSSIVLERTMASRKQWNYSLSCPNVQIDNWHKSKLNNSTIYWPQKMHILNEIYTFQYQWLGQQSNYPFVSELLFLEQTSKLHVSYNLYTIIHQIRNRWLSDRCFLISFFIPFFSFFMNEVFHSAYTYQVFLSKIKDSTQLEHSNVLHMSQ